MKKVVLIIIAVAVLLTLTIYGHISTNQQAQAIARETTPEQPYTEFSAHEKKHHTVYADIVSIVPEYQVTQTLNNQPLSESGHLLCRCQTLNGEEIWVYLSEDDYRAYFDPDAHFDFLSFYYKEIKLDPSFRVIGWQQEAEEEFEDICDELNCTYVLMFSSNYLNFES